MMTERVQFGPWLKPLTAVQEQLVETFGMKMRARKYSTEHIDTPNTVTVVATKAYAE